MGKKRHSSGSVSGVLHGLSGGLTGSVHIFMPVVLLVAFVVGGGYLYSVNQSAVQGYHMRTLEQAIDKLTEENAKLRIAEADLRSLYHIETAEAELGMQKLDGIIYLEAFGPASPDPDESLGGPIALR